MIALLVLWGCTDPCPPGDAPELEIGTGEKDFRAVAAGEDVNEVWGPQGGFHYEVALRGKDLEPKGATIQIEVYHLGELVADRQYLDQDFKCNRTEEATELTDLRISPENPYDSADTGQQRYITGELELKVKVIEYGGREVEATTTWTVDP